MLIHALCEYYDVLSKAGKVLPDGYSKVNVSYKIGLNADGTVGEIINCQRTKTEQVGKKTKEKKIPDEMILPQRTEKPGIDANIIDHRPLYIFGLNLEDNRLTPYDRTKKAEKSHQVFVEKNLEFISDIDTPIVNAFRNFLLNWTPEAETENSDLLRLGKDYGKSGFVFCLFGNPDVLLHEDAKLLEKWNRAFAKRSKEAGDTCLAQCAVTGDSAAPIARIHSKIKGVYGGLATGSVLVGFNNTSENSYGNEQSYNSNISENAMKKYTEALNYLLGSPRHKVLIDDMTIVFWAMEEKESNESLFLQMLFGEAYGMQAEKTEAILKKMLDDARNGWLRLETLEKEEGISPDVDFYMLGLKPNSSRLSMKFLIRKKYADVLWNVARFQQDLQVSENFHTVSLSSIKKELVSPVSSNDKIDPAVFAKFFEAIIYGRNYPDFVYQTMLRRIKTDHVKLNRIRAGVIKAYINRNYPKEEFTVALDKENKNQAYLFGRLFAVLEKLQQEASNNSLNRTIKDAYFASAVSTPALVFPKLMILAQNHLNKVKYPVVYKKLMGEITNKIDGEFKETLSMKEQGQFIIGYYQQYQSFFDKGQKEMEEE